MIKVYIVDQAIRRKALGFLTGRFSYKAFKDGPILVPEAVLASLASEGIQFTVEGSVGYDETVLTSRRAASAED